MYVVLVDRHGVNRVKKTRGTGTSQKTILFELTQVVMSNLVNNPFGESSVIIFVKEFYLRTF